MNTGLDDGKTLEQVIEEAKSDVPSSYYKCSIVLKDHINDTRITFINVDNNVPIGELISQHIPQNRDIENG